MFLALRSKTMNSGEMYGIAATVLQQKISQVKGVQRTQTMVAFEVYSRHDLEALFSVGQ